MSESGITPGLIFGPWPGEVASYNKATRTCMVRIPGISDGGDVLVEAEIRYPVGDKSKAGENSTDILMLPNDLVWLEFIGGDPRYPLITGQRNPRTGNGTDWRRLHQANMELIAAMVMNIKAQNMTLDAGETMVLKAPTIQLQAGGTTLRLSDAGMTANGAAINLN